jgi:GxxExxY protein
LFLTTLRRRPWRAAAGPQQIKSCNGESRLSLQLLRSQPHQLLKSHGNSLGTPDAHIGGMSNIQPFDRDPDTYAIIGAAMAVHSELGCGYLERVYKAALRIEFRRRSIEFRPEVPLPIDYKGERLPLNYRVDFVCGPVLVEAKALSVLAPVHEAQVINYLRASGLKRGLLLNFGATSLQHRRVVWKYESPTP